MADTSQLAAKFTPKDLKNLPNTRQMSAARFTPCGKFLIAAGQDALLHRWDVQADAFGELPSISGHNGWIQDVVFDATGAMISADSWGGLRCGPYAGDSPEALGAHWTVPVAHDGWIRGLAISPDGTLVATGGTDGHVRLWSRADGSRRFNAKHADPVFSVAFHPDGKSLVSSDLKGTINQWDLSAVTATGPAELAGEAPKPVRALSAAPLFALNRLQDVGGARVLAFNADGTKLACGGTKPSVGGNVQGVPTVLVFDWASGAVESTLELGDGGDVYVTDLRFHAEGFLMATVSGNPGAGKLVFRHPEDKQAFFETKKMPNCHSLSLHPQGRRLAIVATNANSNGNGRVKGDAGGYPGNWSPIYVMEL